MERADNPFSPGAGTQPPELAGRDRILEDAEVALRRVLAGRPERSQLLLGLRGVGKTVLLNRLEQQAEALGYRVILAESPEGTTLAELLVPKLRQALLKLSTLEAARSAARRGLSVLRSFAAAFKVKMGDMEFGVDPEPGTADSGKLDSDLPELLVAVAQAARAARGGVAILIDEVQYLSESDLSALIVAVHKIAQKQLPLIVFGAGLPQLAGLMGEAKSYSERLFLFPDVGPLSRDAAREAITAPLDRQNVAIDEAALMMILDETQGYPYFLQEWGAHAWNAAAASPINPADVQRASVEALQALDKGFFRVRLDRLTPRERDYMRAMASLGPGPHRSGEIAQALRIDVRKAGPLRNGLIKKGMIYSPQHGDTAFTVPMFDEFLVRTMRNWSPTP